MDSQPWPEQLRADLRREGLPLHYIDRLVEELADHALDSQTENPSMEAQQAYDSLGTTDQLAATASHEFRRRAFAIRHPLLTFIFGPVAFVPLLFAALTIGAVGVLWAMGMATDLLVGDSWPPPLHETEVQMERWFIWGFESYTRFVPFALAAWIFCRWGQRHSMRRWSLVACGIVAAMAGLLVSTSTTSTADVAGTWMIGFGFHPNLRQLLQLLVPLAIAGLFLLRLPPRTTLLPSFLRSA